MTAEDRRFLATVTGDDPARYFGQYAWQALPDRYARLMSFLHKLAIHTKVRFWRQCPAHGVIGGSEASPDVSSVSAPCGSLERLIVDSLELTLKVLTQDGQEPLFSALVIAGQRTQYLVPQADRERFPVLFVTPCDAPLHAERARHMNGMPYALVFTVGPRRWGNQFRELSAGYILDLRREVWDMWWVFRRDDGRVLGASGHADRAREHRVMRPNLTHARLAFDKVICGSDGSSPEGRRALKRFTEQAGGAFRSGGCPSIDMAAVASGQADVFFAPHVREYELGPIYLFGEALLSPDCVEFADIAGLVTDFQGSPLGKDVYEFQEESSGRPIPALRDVVFAANDKLLAGTIARLTL